MEYVVIERTLRRAVGTTVPPRGDFRGERGEERCGWMR